MDIKRIEKPATVDPNTVIEQSKVSDLKSITKPLDSDSYESGTRDHSGTQGSTPPPEPEKKAGQITGGILAQQMTQARLGSGLHKDKVQQGKDPSQQEELGTDQQNAASGRKHEVKEDSGRPNRTETSSRDKDKQALSDYLAQQGFDMSGGGGGVTSSTGGGSGAEGGASSSSTVVGSRVSQEAKDKFNEMSGGSSGPPSAEDKKDAVSAGLDKQKGYDRTKADVAAEMQAATNPDAQDGKSRVGGYGKNTISDSYWMSGGGPLDYINRYKNEAGEDVEEDVQVRFTKDKTETYITTTWTKDGEQTGQAFWKMEEQKNADGSKTTTISQGEKKDGKVVYVPVSTGTTGGATDSNTTAGSGSSAGKETTEEEYAKQQGEKLHQTMKELGSRFGIDPHALPKPPRFAGDGSDDRESVGKIDLSTNVVVQAGGEVGMVGQPGSPDGTNSGGGGGFSTGGNVDYEDRSGYKGATRTEEPSDVDVTPGMDALNLASRDTKKDEEEKKTTVGTRKKQS